VAVNQFPEKGKAKNNTAELSGRFDSDEKWLECHDLHVCRAELKAAPNLVRDFQFCQKPFKKSIIGIRWQTIGILLPVFPG
jgi:hypothetical protein